MTIYRECTKEPYFSLASDLLRFRKNLFQSYKSDRAIKEKSRGRYKNLSREEKTRLKSAKRKNNKNWFSIKKKH